MSKDGARAALEDAVSWALDAGMTVEEIIEEVRYCLESAEDSR